MAVAGSSTIATDGGCVPGSERGVEGFYRAGQDGVGRWWLLDPAGRPTFLRAVHGVMAAECGTDGGSAADSASRLRRWGFSAAGVGGDGGTREDGLPFLGCVDFFNDSPHIVAPGVRLPDVFMPEWPRLASLHAAEVCGPQRDTRELVGWVTDDRLAWGNQDKVARPSLLQVCLSLEPSFAAYHAAWEFALALHRGKLESLARSWATPVSNKEVVREMTRSENAITTRGYQRDNVRWTAEFSRRYFTATTTAIRAADPNHLVLGCRCAEPAGPHVLAASTYPAVDVALVDWREMSVVTSVARQPIIATEVGWTDPGVKPEMPGRRLTTIERMLQRGRSALERMARHPLVVGYAWAQWQDDAGEQPPFARGLVHLNGVEAREHTELLTNFNRRAESLRRGAASLSPS